MFFLLAAKSAAAVKRTSVDELSAVSHESCITPTMKPTPTTCIAISLGIPKSEHASGISSREPPATPDAPQALIAESPVSHLEPMENEILQRNPIVPPDSESHAEAMRQALAHCTEALSHFEAHDDAYVQAIIDENRPANVELINSILPKKLHIQ